MKMINPESIAEVEFTLDWKSDEASHQEKQLVWVNFWRDILPDALRSQLIGAEAGESFAAEFAPGEVLPSYEDKYRFQLKRRQFNEAAVAPKEGRFYPRGLLQDIYNVYPQNIAPFRCIDINNGHFTADLNHPLSAAPLLVEARVEEVYEKPFDRGGECSVLMDCLTQGPGMQRRNGGKSTDFLNEEALSRQDGAPDSLFYEKPRFVNHIDDRAIETISGLYGKLLKPGMDVLDLMSGWRSHLPESAAPHSVTGLGMNGAEMADNPQLTRHIVHDLNENPTLPFKDGSFDLVLCTVSVEYLTDPIAVFKEVNRVLRPRGRFIVTFSNRWFPPKAIRIWTELHEFERIGLVLDYFLRAGRFKDLQTFSARGWSRPENDKYYPQMPYSDPVYAVWGVKS